MLPGGCPIRDRASVWIAGQGARPLFLGGRLRGRTATQRSKKGSQKVLGRVLGKGF